MSAFVNYCIANPSGATGNLFVLYNYLIDSGILAVLVQDLETMTTGCPIATSQKKCCIYLLLGIGS